MQVISQIMRIFTGKCYAYITINYLIVICEYFGTFMSAQHFYLDNSLYNDIMKMLKSIVPHVVGGV